MIAWADTFSLVLPKKWSANASAQTPKINETCLDPSSAMVFHDKRQNPKPFSKCESISPSPLSRIINIIIITIIYQTYHLTIPPPSIAGSDTTATAIRATFLYIISNSQILSSLLSEISSPPIPLSSPISDSEARKLPYLQAIIKEGLRIFPPVVGLMEKAVPPEGDTLNGRFVPGGTRIGYGAWGIFRNRKVWGEDADVFRPERWLGDDKEKVKEMEGVLGLVFGEGRWQCLGKNVALMELNKVFVEVSLFSL